MVDVKPSGILYGKYCSWEIEGYKTVFGCDLEKELKAYYRELPEPVEATEQNKIKRIGGEKKR